MSIATGPIVQIAWVTDDIDATERLLSEQYGVGEWMRIPDVHFGPEDCTYRGAPADFTAHIALGYSGDLQLELIQPVTGESIYTEFLAGNAPGLHHVCFTTEDIEAACAAAVAAGQEVVQRGSMMGGAMEFAYVAAPSAGAPYIEIARIGPDIQALFDAVKTNAAKATS
ncbi:MAG: lactoylglutathione lyase [Marmoricola sp.]|jgi:catechol 2,3-dioxygenase-like lactoylglutathione lyase family enzyme|nr:lactoylglutathione lyase [Marmoricola sp.]